MTIFVINIGDTKYSQYTLPLIKRLCEYNNINLFVLENNIPQNIYGLHPSWLKLFCFDLVDDDFIICWDLDLAPKMLYDIRSLFDTNKLNMAYDSAYLEEKFVFNGKFKYNCGLIGIPIKYKESMQSIYQKLGRDSEYPSYEQYHVNDWIFDENIDINLLDNGLNTHFDGDDNIPDNGGYNTHYTWKINSNEHRINLIKKHYDKYNKNFFKMEDKTELCDLFIKYKSDKCPQILHSYSKSYYELLKTIKNDVKHVIEIGIGNDELMKPICGDSYEVGASLRAWRDFFINANIYGLDIREDVLFNENRINTFYTDQSKDIELEKTIDKIKEFNNNHSLEFDLIIDDGSHIVEHMLLTIKTLSKYLKVGGIFIIEDIRNQDINIFTELKLNDFEIIKIYNGVDHWDDFVAYKKIK
jgi:hypothetical protein